MDRFTETEQKAINMIDVINPVASEPEICGNATRVCDPESYFDTIEQCKICGKCV